MICPAGVIRGQSGQIATPSGMDRRTGSQAFEAVTMKGAHTRKAMVAWIATHGQVSHLRMHQTLVRAQGRGHPAPDPRPCRDISQRPQSLSGAEFPFSPRRGAYIGVDDDRHCAMLRAEAR